MKRLSSYARLHLPIKTSKTFGADLLFAALANKVRYGVNYICNDTYNRFIAHIITPNIVKAVVYGSSRITIKYLL